MSHDSSNPALPDIATLMTGLIDDALYPLHEKIARRDDKTLSQDDYDKLVCYKTSANNAIDCLIDGCTSINNLLCKAITNRDNPATQEDVLKTASMLATVSQILQNLLIVRDDAEYILNEASGPAAPAQVVTIPELRSVPAS